MPTRDKVVLVTRKTALEELVERFNSRAQAKFLLEKQGGSFADIEAAHATYHAALAMLKTAVPRGVRLQTIDRGFLPNFLFGPHDLVVTLGPDGLVVNTAKYLREQPLLAFNPDPQRMDGVLIPFAATQAAAWLPSAIDDTIPTKLITMAVAKLDDGQSLFAVNDLFIGQRTHVSARYRLAYRKKAENQSSSGIIVSTGAGSTGWYRSILAGASGIAAGLGDQTAAKLRERYRFAATAAELRFSVREPFTSKITGATIVYGHLRAGEYLAIVSQMPQGGVIFSDGIESDYLNFESGRLAYISVADRKVHLLTNETLNKVAKSKAK
jgi:NAD kinase